MFTTRLRDLHVRCALPHPGPCRWHGPSASRGATVPQGASVGFLLHRSTTIAPSFPPPWWKEAVDWKKKGEGKKKENIKQPRHKNPAGWKAWAGVSGRGPGRAGEAGGYPSSRDCSLTCGFHGQHAGQKHFAQCLFSCLALTNKVYGSSMENVCCFFLFFFSPFFFFSLLLFKIWSP